MRISLFLALGTALLSFIVVSCGGSDAPANAPTTPPAAVQHLYVPNDNTTGAVVQYKLPLTNSSSATATLTGAATSDAISMVMDSSGNFALGDYMGHVHYFGSGFSSTATASVNFNNTPESTVGQMVFNSAGDLFIASGVAVILEYNHGLTSASTSALTITDISLNTTVGLAFDAAENLYVSNNSGSSSDIAVFAKPYGSAPTVSHLEATTAYRKIAVSSTQLFVADVHGATGKIDVYTLPIVTGSTPAFSLTAGVNGPEAVALDASGNLYVGNDTNTTITVYKAPITSASVPSATVTVSTGAFSIFGLAIGP